MQRFSLPNDRELLSLKEVARFLPVTPRTVARWCRNGNILGVRVGGSWRILRGDLLSAVVPHPDAASPQPAAEGDASTWSRRAA